MKQYLVTLGLIVVFMGGFAYGSFTNYVDKIDHCVSFKQNGVEWQGYRAISEDNRRRCFWLEDKYPYRVKQGVERI